MHDFELAAKALEVASQALGADPVEVAKRLKQRELQPQVFSHPANIGRRAVEIQQIVLEDLDASKPAAWMAVSFSTSVPLIETVAIERCRVRRR